MISVNIQKLKYCTVGFHILVEALWESCGRFYFVVHRLSCTPFFATLAARKQEFLDAIGCKDTNNQKLQSGIAKQYLRISQQNAFLRQLVCTRDSNRIDDFLILVTKENYNFGMGCIAEQWMRFFAII